MGRPTASAGKTLGKMRGAVFALTGDKKLMKTLAKVRDSVARKAMRKALGKAVRIIAKGIKAQVPTDLKQMKPLIGTKTGKTRRESFTAKAGAGVGKGYGKIGKRSGNNKQGVGISGSNIHWWVMGTGNRTSSKGPRGIMPPQAKEIVTAGFSASASAAADVIRTDIAATLAAVKAK